MGITFVIRRWFHVRTAKKCGIEPDDYANWYGCVKDWPMRRAVPSAIKWRIRKSRLWGGVQEMDNRLKNAAKGMCMAGGAILVVLGILLLVEWVDAHYGNTGLTVAIVILLLVLGAILGFVDEPGEVREWQE